jgi:hypothetical protein
MDIELDLALIKLLILAMRTNKLYSGYFIMFGLSRV